MLGAVRPACRWRLGALPAARVVGVILEPAARCACEVEVRFGHVEYLRTLNSGMASWNQPCVELIETKVTDSSCSFRGRWMKKTPRPDFPGYPLENGIPQARGRGWGRHPNASPVRLRSSLVHLPGVRGYSGGYFAVVTLWTADACRCGSLQPIAADAPSGAPDPDAVMCRASAGRRRRSPRILPACPRESVGN